MSSAQPFETRSSVLMIGHPHKQRVELGAHCVDNYSQAQIYSNLNSYSVIVVPLSNSNLAELKQFVSDLEAKAGETLLILVREDCPQQQFVEVLSQYYIYKIVDSYEDPRLEKFIFTALEKSDFIKQNKQLVHLTNDQNMKLVAFKEDLQNRINRRKKSLIKSQKRFETVNQKINAINEAYFCIHQSADVETLEKSLYQSLHSAFDLQQIIIYFNHKSGPMQQPALNEHQTIFTAPLIVQQKQLGRILYIRQNKKTFSKDEKEFLNEVSEAVVIALDRLNKRKQAQILKVQWQSTFNAFENPICITSDKFQVLQTNNGFEGAHKDLLTQNIFSAFFKDQKLQTKFEAAEDSVYFQKGIINNQNISVTYEVIAQKIPFDDIGAEHVWLFIIRDISEKVRLERQILESSKMAELGTIGSSIAHELNNPLGGMINFLQLIKMDLKIDHPLMEDIEIMLEASLKCKSIVENLLGFARKSSIYEKEDVDLKTAIGEAISISQIQIMSGNIKINFSATEKTISVKGNQNQLVQAFCNVISNSIEAIRERQLTDKKLIGNVDITLDNDQLVSIKDNGVGIAPEFQPLIFNPLFTTKRSSNNSGLGLTLAYQIFNNHAANMEIISQPMGGTSAKIAF